MLDFVRTCKHTAGSIIPAAKFEFCMAVSKFEAGFTGLISRIGRGSSHGLKHLRRLQTGDRCGSVSVCTRNV
jgi:hypothetical protein